jgi:VanZ family protein
VAEPFRPSPLPSGDRRILAAWLPVLLLEALVLFLSSRPHLSLPSAIPHLDKAAHFTEYALLGCLLRRALAMTLPGGRGATIVAIFLVALLGAGDELFQSTVPGRESSPMDWLGDLLGGATGAVVMYLRRPRPNKPESALTRTAEGTNG